MTAGRLGDNTRRSLSAENRIAVLEVPPVPIPIGPGEIKDPARNPLPAAKGLLATQPPPRVDVNAKSGGTPLIIDVNRMKPRVKNNYLISRSSQHRRLHE